jgi:hypothetical protein
MKSFFNMDIRRSKVNPKKFSLTKPVMHPHPNKAFKKKKKLLRKRRLRLRPRPRPRLMVQQLTK